MGRVIMPERDKIRELTEREKIEEGVKLLREGAERVASLGFEFWGSDAEMEWLSRVIKTVPEANVQDRLVVIPWGEIERCLNISPSRWSVYGLDEMNEVKLGADTRTNYFVGGEAAFVIRDNGRERTAEVGSRDDLVRIVDQVEKTDVFDGLFIPITPHELEVSGTPSLDKFFLVRKHTKKHVITGALLPEEIEAMTIDTVEQRERPSFSSIYAPMMGYRRMEIQKLFSAAMAARRGVPIWFSLAPIMGSDGPIHTQGVVAQTLAEFGLANLIIQKAMELEGCDPARVAAAPCIIRANLRGGFSPDTEALGNLRPAVWAVQVFKSYGIPVNVSLGGMNGISPEDVPVIRRKQFEQVAGEIGLTIDLAWEEIYKARSRLFLYTAEALGGIGCRHLMEFGQALKSFDPSRLTQVASLLGQVKHLADEVDLDELRQKVLMTGYRFGENWDYFSQVEPGGSFLFVTSRQLCVEEENYELGRLKELMKWMDRNQLLPHRLALPESG